MERASERIPSFMKNLPGKKWVSDHAWHISEVYLADDTRSFAFLLLKYCVGFLYLIFIPIVTLAFQEEIRNGVYTVFDGTTSVGNPNNNPAEMAALAAAEAAATAAATSPGSGDRQSSRVNST